MDVFVEQVVTRKRRGMYEALFYVCWVLLVICALAGLSGLMNILYTSADGGLGFRPLAIGMAVVFLGAAFLLWRASMRLRTEEERPAEEDYGHARGQRTKAEAAVRARVDDVHKPGKPHKGAENEQHPTGVKQQFIQRAALARHDLLQKNIHCAPPNLSILYYSISWAIVDRTWGKNMKFPRRRMQFAGKYSIM